MTEDAGPGFDEKYDQMVNMPVEGLVCRFAAPAIVSMLVSALYNMADTYFVGALGTSATAGVGVVFSLMSIIQAAGFFFGNGSGNYVSRQLGGLHIENAAKMASTGFFSALASGSVIMALGLMFLEPLARFLGATETILPYACDYLRFILIGVPWMVASLMLNSLLRFQGSAFYGMIGIAGGAVINIALDPILIFGMGMGVVGASLATMISQFTGFCMLLYGCARHGNIMVNLKNFTPRIYFFKEIFRGGGPSLLRQGIAGAAVICMNRMAGSYGDAAIAAISIVQRVIMFANSAMIGFGQGFQPVCGFNYGAERFDRVSRAFWFCVRVSTAMLFASGIAGIAMAPSIIAVFRGDDPAVISIGTTSLRLNCALFPLVGWVILNNMMLQTIGMAGRASILAVSRQGLFLLPAIFILTSQMGLIGLLASQPVADFATFLLSLPLGLGVLGEMKRRSDSMI
ncbi:MAG: MATE family efflux transporter [Synergistaceae bacterium]|jgi:putative MATE family efflux protein|nr:MATE family efflux transporter [Synergistaceae bacterium]